MSRRTRRIAPQAIAVTVLVAVAWLAGCQDYNFSPVKYCLVQPGTERVTLSDISTADLLFVVDDSGSMGGEQKKLADSFDAFVQNLTDTNTLRVQSRLEPIDFHIAVTTTSIFKDRQPASPTTCSRSCGGTGAQTVCCQATNLPLTKARGCGADADCTFGNKCLTTCAGRLDTKTCCSQAGALPEEVPVTCTQVGEPCGQIVDHYQVARSARLCGKPIAGGGGALTSCAAGPNKEVPNPAPGTFACRDDCNGLAGTTACCEIAAPHGLWLDEDCQLGVAKDGGPYPRGDFVRKGTNPRVLHFDKSIYCDRATDPSTSKEVCACTLSADPQACNTPGGNAAAIPGLKDQFKQNIAVGTCGSGQEQGLEAARLAIRKALGLDGLAQPLEDSGPDAGKVPAWPHPRKVVGPNERATSKLVVVFVGDEDDCSSPEDPTGGIIFDSIPPGSPADACEVDAQQRRTRLQDYADFLSGLGRPVAGAFIVSAVTETCVDQSCEPGLCCDTACTGDAAVCSLSGLCGGQGAGGRFLALSKLLPGKAAATVVGSVCNPGASGSPGFSSILERVAEVVKQPAGLELPTQPAAARLTLLRIAAPDGKTRKTCFGPAPAATLPPAVTPVPPSDPTYPAYQAYVAAVAAAVSAAEAAGYDWWFTGGEDTNRAPTGPSKFIYLNRLTHNCEANPGETYSADYLGLVPQADPAKGIEEGCLTAFDCQLAIGGADWTCDLSQGGARGTCLCGSFPP